MEGILDVTLADNAKMTNNLNGSITKHVILLIRQGLRWGHDNTIAGMNTERIEVLHVTHGDTGKRKEINKLRKGGNY